MRVSCRKQKVNTVRARVHNIYIYKVVQDARRGAHYAPSFRGRDCVYNAWAGGGGFSGLGWREGPYGECQTAYMYEVDGKIRVRRILRVYARDEQADYKIIRVYACTYVYYTVRGGEADRGP